MSAVGLSNRQQIRQVLEDQDLAVTLTELHDLLPTIEFSELRNQLMNLVKGGVVWSSGSKRDRQEPSYELWDHVTRRMQRARRRAEPRNPVALVGVRAFNARRIA